MKEDNKPAYNSVYKPLLVAGLRKLVHLVALFYLDNKSL